MRNARRSAARARLRPILAALGFSLGLGLTQPGRSSAAPTAPPLESGCAAAALVDPAFRDAAVLMMRRLVVRAPGQISDGAIRRTLSPAHVDASGRAWHHIAAYEANLGLIGALRIDPTLREEAARWLRWQIRHLPVDGQDRGVLFDRWISADGREMTVCPPDIEPRHCRQIDATPSRSVPAPAATAPDCPTAAAPICAAAGRSAAARCSTPSCWASASSTPMAASSPPA